MKTRLIHILTFVAGAIFSLANAKGQPTDSLSRYLEVAAKHNPLVQQRYHDYLAALQKVPQVGALPDPELSAGIFLSPMELVGGNQVADLRLMQMFPWFGVLKNAKDEMSLMAKAKYEVLRDTKLQLFFEVEQTWLELLKLQEDIRIGHRNMEVLRTLERLALARFKAAGLGGPGTPTSPNMAPGTTTPTGGGMSQGMGSMGQAQSSGAAPTPPPAMSGSSMAPSGGSALTDLYRLQIEISQLDNAIVLLQSKQQTAKARFNAFLNRRPESEVVLADSLRPYSEHIDMQTVRDSMMARHPMLAMLQHEQQAMEARKKMVARMGYPMVGVGVNYALINKSDMSMSAMNGKDMVMPMVSVTLPIYRKKYKAMQLEADLLQTVAKQGYQQTANSLETEYYQAMELHHDAHRRMALYQQQSQLASQSLSILTKSFAASGSGLTDLLLVRQQLLDYDSKLAEAVADYNISIAWLRRLGGS